MTKAVFAIFSGLSLNIIFTILASKKIEPVYTYFYPIAWYTFLVFISGINFLISKKEFTIFNWKNFIKAGVISYGLWLIFELFNLRLKNWAYHGIPLSSPILPLFGFLSYATVVLGIFNVANLLERIFKVKPKEITVNQSSLDIFLVLGIVSTILVLVLPKFCFPLVWLCFIFLMEPLNFYIFKKTIIFRELHKVPFLILSGLICGFLWEYWNYFSGARWVYTLPWEFLMRPKIFEMPILGYFGFPPFAIEVYQIYNFAINIIEKYKNKLWLLVLLYIPFCMLSVHLITVHSVASFK